MAEAAGLAIGVVALAGSLRDCVELFSYFSAARSFSKDFEVLATKFDLEKTLLLQWADRVNLLEHQVEYDDDRRMDVLKYDYDARLDVPGTQKAVGQILASIKLLLSSGADLKQRYGLKKVSNDQVVGLETPVSAFRMSSFIDHFKQLEIRLNLERDDVSAVSKLRWVVHDKDKFDRLIAELSYFVSKLQLMIPDQSHLGPLMSKFDIQNLSPRNLQLLRSALPSSRVDLANAVERT